MSETTTKLLLPYILAAQAQKHVTHNEALRMIDGLVQMSVPDRDLTAPPVSPVEGDRYIVASAATGDWSGWDHDIALFGDGIWFRLPKQIGWRAWVEDEGTLVVWDGAQWYDLSGVVGSDGASAYEVWIAEGNAGSEAAFLASLVGADGAPGPEGPPGPAGAEGAIGPQGPAGVDGADGTSVAILGLLASTGDLPGSGNTPGDGYIIAGDLHVWDGTQWNNVGPIQGPQGDPGADGSPGADGIDGASAYQIWLDAGNTGTEADYLAALVGPEGPPGPAGPEGPQGPAGADGVDGADGQAGIDGTGFNWRGPWAVSIGYAANDVVEAGGSVFICGAVHTSAAADEPGIGASWATQWDLFASGADLSAQGTLGSGPVVLARRSVNAQAGSYTLVIGDEGAAIHLTGASAVTLTVPTNSAVAFPTGSEIEVVALGAGVVSITGDTGVSINGVSAGSADIAAQWQGAVLRKYAADAWLLIGAVGEVA